MKQIESRREKAMDIVRKMRSRNNISRQRNSKIGLVHLRKLFSQGQIVFALYEIDAPIESQLLCFKKQNTKDW